MLEILKFEFAQNAILAGFLASIICGIIGTLIVVNRIVFISGGIAHASYGGIGIAAFLKTPFIPTAILFSLCSAILMGFVTLKEKHRADAIIGIIWAVGMAIGIILLDLTPGYNIDLMSYLFGNIITVSKIDIVAMFFLGVFIILIIGYFYTDFLAMSYDEEFAQTKGVHVKSLYFILLCITAISIVMLVKVVGMILVIALLTISPYISEKHSSSLLQMMILSSFLSFLFILIGLFVSYKFNLTSGAVIILVGSFSFAISIFINKIKYLIKESICKHGKINNL